MASLVSTKSYRQVVVDGINRRVHVVVWEEAYGPVPEGMHVDHKDGDIHNNELSNLRLATVSQNISNSKIYSTNQTGLKGLSWDVGRERWRGAIKSDFKQHSIRGDLLTVCCWLFTQRLALHGEFARFK